MLSTAIVVSQHDNGGVLRRITSASTAGADAAFAMPTKSAGLLTVFCSVNAVVPYAMPVMTNCTGVVLEDTSTDWNLNGASLVTTSSPTVVEPRAEVNCTDGAGRPVVADTLQFDVDAATVNPHAV